MQTTSNEIARGAGYSRIALLTLVLACALWACGSDRGNPTGTAGSSASGGASGSGGNGTSSGDASPEDVRGPIDGAAIPDGMTKDRANVDDAAVDTVSPPNLDATDNPNCRLPTATPVQCYVADPPPPRSPVVQCLRSPREFADPMGYIGQTRMHGDTLYWTTSTNIVGIWQKKGPASPETLLVRPNIGWFDVDDVAVYFATIGDAGQTSLMRMNLDRTGLTMLIPDLGSWVFAIDDDRIYFDTSDGKFVATSKSGGGMVKVVPGPANVGQIVRVSGTLIDATHIYWNEGDAPDITLKRVAKGTANIETLAAHLPGPAQLLQGDSVLLVAESRYILEVPKTGGCPQLLVSTAGFSSMTADNGALYWASSYPSDLANALLYRAPRTGGAVVDLFSTQQIRGPLPQSPLFLTPTQVIFATEPVYSSKSTIQVVDRF